MIPHLFLSVLLAVGACAPAVRNETSAASPSPRGSPVREAPAPVLLTRPAPPGAVYHAAGLEGMLSLEDGCFFLRTPARRFLLVFPDGTRWDAAGGTIRFGDQQLRPGSRVALSGDTGSGSGFVAPGFDARGCDATRIFRVNPWRAG